MSTDPLATGTRANAVLVHAGPPSRQAGVLHRTSRILIKPTLNGLISLYGMLVAIGPAGTAKSRFIQWPVAVADYIARPLVPVRGSVVEMMYAPPSGLRIEKVTGPGVDPEAEAAIVWFHGGGLVAGGFNSHRRLLSRLSAEAATPAYSVEYRLQIEHTFADAVADGLLAYRALLATGLDPSRMVFGGDSGGCAVALATALAVRDAGLCQPAGLVLLSPWVDFDPTTKLADPRARLDAAIPITGAWPLSGGRLMAEHVLASSIADAARLSPINATLGGLPPVLIHAAESEILSVDALALHTKLGAEDVESTVKLWPGLIHMFQLAADLVPEGRESLAEVGEFVSALTASATG
ncbi:alpha/beta hydrolase fold domain-containing protein [Antrihabitans sp. YC2-6]|uniref:alpha/beta hydrolase fold domain-containing protein n=1 Tax=Antrihabitans sp. YC2-6 TaxID=2799498 RepID=UPI0018F70B0F|nr:alpha/beta hydrolase fold domain-containing protein [Antrihabitans sp. YC2-6]MBJ8343813.1 alpha/beta hydrolase fold domain-containing protein [Antrihabitans sp. YC2-6]